MSENTENANSAVPYVLRVLHNDATKKGAAAAIAGVLVAVVTEALWPSK
jgi:hypothetical protein